MAHTPERKDLTNSILNSDSQFNIRQKLTLSKLFRHGVVGKVQTADQTVTASTTLVDSELRLPVKKGRKYRIEGVLHPSTTATPGFKACLTYSGQSSPTLTGTIAYTGSGTSGYRVEALASGTATGGATAYMRLTIEGYFVPDGNGYITVQFAQNTSDAAGATLKAGSWLRLVEA